MNNTALLLPMHRRQRPAKPSVRPLSNLDKYKLLAIAHIKVKLAASKQLIPCNQREALRLQESQGKVFGSLACGARGD